MSVPGESGTGPLLVSSAEELRELTGADFTLSDQQWAAVSAPFAPGVVIAGAGSGKTEVMAARVVYLVANGLVRAEEVLGLTFTTKAAAELGERIRRTLATAGLDRAPVAPVAAPEAAPEAAPGTAPGTAPVTAAEPTSEAVEEDAQEPLEPTVATYNAYAAALLDEHGLRIGHEPDLRVMADASRYQLAGRTIEHHRGTAKLLSDHPGTVIRWMLALDGAMSDHLVAPSEVRDFHRRQRPLFEEALAASRARTQIEQALRQMTVREELLDLVGEYRDLKHRFGLIDFSDQIARAHQLATEHPDVGRRERQKFKVVLLDEYQDTSVAQAWLLSALFSGPDEASGRGHPVTAVGDPHQAIYGWRGASVANILGFHEAFPSATGGAGGAGSSYPLTVSRRSDLRILEVANALAGPLYSAHGPGADAVRPLEPKPEAATGVVRAAVHETAHEELDWLAGQVREAHERYGSWDRIAVLVRTNKHAAQAYDLLSERGVPVEIVGIGGLLRLPEVAEVVATLTLVDDLTDNAAVLTLLTGPRWQVGPRDLALLGRRARDLAGTVSTARDEQLALAQVLEESVAGVDPTEISSLSDALADPGELPYSAEARERFALLAGELRTLRRHAGEPLLDLLRRVVDTTGLDLELAASTSPAAGVRRDNLELFVRAVADFEALDGQVTLAGLLAWLQAEDEFGEGLDATTPSEADSVKLLTVHRAKGLQYDAVFVVGVGRGRFPVGRSHGQWTTQCQLLPSPLRGDAASVPQLRGHDKQALETYVQEVKDADMVEERRLAYVAFTRPRHELVVSAHVWGETQKPIGPSEYLTLVREVLQGWGEAARPWHETELTHNPSGDEPVVVPWPVRTRTEETERRLRAAERVRAARPVPPAVGNQRDPDLAPEDSDLVATWDRELERLLAERVEGTTAATGEVEVPMPASLSATSLSRLRDDPEAFARDVARPMPRRPVPQARFGTRFHAWVEARFGQQTLLDPDELPGRADTGIDDDADLQQVVAAFESGPFGHRRPYAVEPPFSVVVAGQVVRGRIDAVYALPGADAEHAGGEADFLIVDWKTNQQQTADPLQLAVYRLGWAELAGVPVERVRAAFFYVRSGELVEPPDLPGRAGLEELLSR